MPNENRITDADGSINYLVINKLLTITCSKFYRTSHLLNNYPSTNSKYLKADQPNC